MCQWLGWQMAFSLRLQHVLVNSNNVCFNLNIKYYKGQEKSIAEHICLGKGFMILYFLLYVFVFRTFTLAFFPGKRYLLLPTLLSLMCVGGCVSLLEGNRV